MHTIESYWSPEPWMRLAIEQAKIASIQGEIPVGAVIVKNKEVIASAYNLREQNRNATAHAELLAIERACAVTGTWRLSGCILYATLEPCPMCAGAIINARIDRVLFGAYDKKAGCCGSLVNLFEMDFNHKPDCMGGILEQECTDLLQDFFRKLREKKS